MWWIPCFPKFFSLKLFPDYDTGRKTWSREWQSRRAGAMRLECGLILWRNLLDRVLEWWRSAEELQKAPGISGWIPSMCAGQESLRAGKEEVLCSYGLYWGPRVWRGEICCKCKWRDHVGDLETQLTHRRDHALGAGSCHPRVKDGLDPP